MLLCFKAKGLNLMCLLHATCFSFYCEYFVQTVVLKTAQMAASYSSATVSNVAFCDAPKADSKPPQKLVRISPGIAVPPMILSLTFSVVSVGWALIT